MGEICEGRPLRVIIVDDHPMVREGTRALLERTPGIHVIGIAGDGAAPLRLMRQQQPDVLILDIRLPDRSGIEVARQVRAAFPQTSILILTGYEDIGYSRAIAQLGVEGYLQKTASGEEIIAAVLAAAKSTLTLETEPLHEYKSEPLTARQREVLRLLMAGQRNAEIAHVLGVSVKTVEFHVSHVLEKLGARSRAEAIGKAHQEHIMLVGEASDRTIR